MPIHRKSDHYSLLGSLTTIKRISHGIEAAVGSELVRVEVLRQDILRIKISIGGVFDNEPSCAVRADFTPEEPPFKLVDHPLNLLMSTDQFVLTINKAPFSMSTHRLDDSAIFADLENSGYSNLNEDFVVTRKCLPEDAFYGLGEKTGRFNRRGRSFTLWNTDVLSPDAHGEFTAGLSETDPRTNPTSTEFDPYYMSIPFFYHLDQRSGTMAGFFIDNPYRGTFNFQPKREYSFGFHGGQYTEYIFVGPEMADILEGYTWLTGRIPAPPLWSLGNHQCRWFDYSQETLLELGETYRSKSLPCDVLWLDIGYMNGYRVFTWNKKLFPDVKNMLSKLTEQGFRVITIIDPGVKYEPGYSVFDEANARDALCKTSGGAIYAGQVWPGKTAFPDFSTETGRSWWGEQNALHVQSGIAGIWNDMNEPATGEIDAESMRFDGGMQPHARFHNLYGMLMAMSTVDGLLKAMPDRRTFVLSRAGSAGIQRYAANWMGDNMSRWDHLWMSLPMALGLGISGQPFVGADIGGFGENCNAELLIRWMQCGALTPFCRNHNDMGGRDQYPWAFGPVVEQICRRALELRYRMMPYIYAAFLAASEKGTPIQRPLIFDFQDDPTVWDIDDQYLFGASLLVAPVFEPGKTARQVYLPEGNWYDWHSDSTYSGKQFLIAPTPMQHIPIFVRGGSVIPMWPDPPPVSTMAYRTETIELNVYAPVEDGEYRSFFQEDDGTTFAFRDGAFRRIELLLTRKSDCVALKSTPSGNGDSAMKWREIKFILHGFLTDKVAINKREIALHNDQLTIPAGDGSFLLEAIVHQ